MQADLNLLRQLIHGAEAVTEEDGNFHFSRFTEAEREVYRSNPDFYMKSFASSGISLKFTTDSGNITLDYRIYQGSSRSFYYFDVFVNGTLFAHDGHEAYGKQPCGTLNIPLPAGMKSVEIYFPCLTRVEVSRLIIDDGAQIEPVRKERKIISYGDSITQGYDARYPSLTYPGQLADALDAEVINKGIGGEVFNPALLTEDDKVKPDLITVAYGTNDWGRSNAVTGEELKNNVEDFCRKLTTFYPDTPVAAILPLWRKDCGRIAPAGTFAEAREIIRSVYLQYPAIKIIDGFTLMPHDVSFFSDGYLHPNDAGFAEIGKNIIEQLEKKL